MKENCYHGVPMYGSCCDTTPADTFSLSKVYMSSSDRCRNKYREPM